MKGIGKIELIWCQMKPNCSSCFFFLFKVREGSVVNLSFFVICKFFSFTAFVNKLFLF